MARADEPNDAAGWVALGAAHGKAGRREDALACFEKALAMDPKNGAAWASKAAVLSQLDRHEEAVRAFDEGKPFMAPSMHGITRRFHAASLQAVGRSAEALAIAAAAVEANAYDSASWLAKAEAEMKLGKRADAVRSLRRLMTMIDKQSPLFARAHEMQEVLELDEGA